jgi:CheY-like chemotaxis protein/class 3 adenylate cyclase
MRDDTLTDTLGRILVVDDDRVNREILVRTLQKQGYDLATADDGHATLALLRLQRFDLILLDISMPEMDGYQVLEQIRGDPALREIPVVMLSAIEQAESIARCLEIGAVDYLTKPFNAVILRARVGACLERKRLRDRELEYLRNIDQERRRADRALNRLLPETVADEIKATATLAPRRHENVAVVFADVVDFTEHCSTQEPDAIIADLQEMVAACETLAAKHGIQKIKTIGDCFMATAGLLKAAEHPVASCVDFGLELLPLVRSFAAGWDLRLGIDMGPVIAGIIGHRQYQYDIWGDTVNTAARVQTAAPRGAIGLSARAWDTVADRYEAVYGGAVPLKGKGETEVFFITSGAGRHDGTAR